MPSNHLILCRPLLLLSSIFPSIRVFSNESALPIRWPKYWISALPMNIQGWFPLDWLVWSPCCPRDSQESSPAPQVESINSLVCLLYGLTLTSVHDTGKNIALTICTFIGKVMSLLFNMLSRFVIAFLPESKRLLISWLQFLSTVILEPQKIKSVTVSIFRIEYAQSYLTLCDPMDCSTSDFLVLH